MFTPADAIAKLDEALLKAGETVAFHVLTRGDLDAGLSLPAFVRAYRPDELVNGITQQDRRLILSPTGLVATPKDGDRIVIGASQACNVEGAPKLFRMAGVVVRIELQVRG